MTGLETVAAVVLASASVSGIFASAWVKVKGGHERRADCAKRFDEMGSTLDQSVAHRQRLENRIVAIESEFRSLGQLEAERGKVVAENFHALNKRLESLDGKVDQLRGWIYNLVAGRRVVTAFEPPDASDGQAMGG